MIGDPELKVAKLYDMLPADAGDTSEGRTAANNATVRTVFVVGPDKKIKLMLIYPMSTGRNFDEVLRVLDSIQLTAKHKVATPVNWKNGDDIVIVPARVGRRSEAEISGRLEDAQAVPALWRSRSRRSSSYLVPRTNLLPSWSLKMAKVPQGAFVGFAVNSTPFSSMSRAVASTSSVQNTTFMELPGCWPSSGRNRTTRVSAPGMPSSIQRCLPSKG